MFRAEALEAQKRQLHGDVFLVQPISFSIITLTIASAIALVIALLFTGSYARSELVQGHLVPSGGLAKIHASQFGILRQLHVVVGDTVQKGQELLEVQVSQNKADGRSFASKGLAALHQQKAILETQVALENTQLSAELAKLRAERESLELRASFLEKQITLQKQITTSAEAAFKDVQVILEKGFISKLESEQRKQAWLDQQSQEQMKLQEQAEVLARLELIDLRIEQAPYESRQRLALIETQQSELEERIAAQESTDAYVVTAPVAGRIVAISSGSIGGTVQGGQFLLTILPESSRLEVELFVPSKAAGFVEKGQDVRLLFDAFPYERFGSFPATVTQVSETVLTPSEARAPFAIGEPIYRVRASLEESAIPVRDKKIPLQNGMTLKANIVLERRSFFDWLFEPLKAVGARS